MSTPFLKDSESDLKVLTFVPPFITEITVFLLSSDVGLLSLRARSP